MARTGKIINAWKDPLLDAYHVEAIAEGVPVHFIVTRKEINAATSKKAKRVFLRDKALAALDERVISSDLQDLLGEFEP